MFRLCIDAHGQSITLQEEHIVCMALRYGMSCQVMSRHIGVSSSTRLDMESGLLANGGQPLGLHEQKGAPLVGMCVTCCVSIYAV